MSARAPIDRQALDAATGGDDALARELLHLYAPRAEGLARALAATPASHKQALRDLAHGARGSALAVGALAVAQAAAVLEAAADADAPQGANFAAEVGRAREALLRVLEDSRNEALGLADSL